MLQNLTTLESLDLSHNSLQDKVILMGLMGRFPNLTYLGLASNQFENLPVKDVMTYKKLKELHIQNNEITTYYPELTDQVKMGLDIFYEGEFQTK